MHLREQRHDNEAVYVESAGTGPWHVGNPPHPHTVTEAHRRGIMMNHRGQQFGPTDFDRFDLVIAMDQGNVADLESLAPDAQAQTKVVRLGAFAPGPEGSQWAGVDGADVPDPYGHPAEAFATMFDQVESGCRGLLHWMSEGNAS